MPQARCPYHARYRRPQRCAAIKEWAMHKFVLSVSAGLAFLAAAFGGSLFLAERGHAQSAAETAQMRAQRPLPGRQIEGRLAFLRTELKITEAQAPLWDRVAAALRDRAAKMDAAVEARRQARSTGTTPDLLAEIEARIRSGEQRTESARAFLAAFRPLYQSLSDEQKTAANELFGRHRRR
jgi:LTXXQ motif family protein